MGGGDGASAAVVVVVAPAAEVGRCATDFSRAFKLEEPSVSADTHSRRGGLTRSTTRTRERVLEAVRSPNASENTLGTLDC